MEHKNSMSRVERLHREKVTRYSIRKYSFGAASVAVAALFMFLGNGAVSANELSKQDTPSVEASAPASENKTTSEEATAKPVEATTPTLDKSELTNLISEIETKLSNGSYDNKTEESVAVLKADLESAKATLANATTQAELKKAYSKLVITANTKLKNKPVEKKETPAVDTTNGKETVGKKAENTEKKSESNSIENTGSKDERNGQALDKNNAFRAETPETQGNFTYSMEYSNSNKKEIYLYNEENADIDITVNSTAGDITKATVKSGSGQFLLKSKRDAVKAGTKPQPVEEENEIDGFGWTYRQTLTPTKGPVTIKITGKPNDEFKGLSAYKKTEDQNAVLGARYLQLENSNGEKLAAGSNLKAPGGFNLVVKSQTYKYDIQPVAEENKVPVADINSLTAPEITKIKEKIKIQYSDTATREDARLASHKGEVLANRSSVVKNIDVASGTVTVTYNDDSVDTTPVANVARVNAAPTVEIPFSVDGKKDVYVYANEDFDIPIKFKDDNGKVASATITRGGNVEQPPKDASNPNILNNEFNTTVEKISTETVATAETPAIVKIKGNISKDNSGIPASSFPKTAEGELKIVTRYATATDTDGAYIKNTATEQTYASDPGSFTIKLKAQTAKYDIKDPETKVTVANANNITEDEFNQIKDSIKIQYSATNPDKNLLDKQGKDVENQTDRIESITREGNNVVVTYKDGSKDTKALADFVNVAPKVALPYSNEANKQIYVYTGENTDLTFKGTDENEVKDLYLRGPGDISGNNAAGYGLPTGKVENGAVTGEGSVSEDKRTATIKMTGKTNLPAGQQWTSFIVSKDNDGKLSNTDYRALDKDPNARQKPGYAHFLVKNQTFKYDIATPTEKVAVADPANVTQDELDKIKEKLQIEYSKRNDDANLAEKKGKAVDAEDAKTKIKSVEKDANGNLVVTYTDGSKDTRSLSEFVTLDKQPAIEAVEKAAEAKIDEINKTPNATDDEKQAAIDKVNADKKKALDEIAKPEVTTKEALDTAKTAGTTAIVGDNPVVAKKDAAKADVETARKAKEDAIKANPNLTQAEKDAAIAKNNTAAEEATKAIDSATTNDAVDKAKEAGTGEIAKVNPVAKAAAKKAVADELAEKEKAIDARTDLTDAEKTAAKDDAKAKVKEATDAINAQPDNAETPEAATTAQTAVNNAKDKGVADVKAVNPVAKEAAKKAVADELAEKEKAIDARTDLTDAEKTAAKDDAKAKAKEATDAIDAQPSNAATPEEAATAQTAVNNAKDKGVADVKAVNPVAKEAAKKAVADELAEKEKAIDKRTDLTDEEKAAAKDDAKAKAKAATDAIDAQPSNATTPEEAEKAQTAVNGAKDKGVADVTAVNPVAAKKSAAKADVETARKAKEDAIKANPNLTQAEKDAAIAKNNTAAEEATKAIDSATTNDGVDKAKEAGTGEIAKVNPVAKEAAKKAVADELAEKEKAIDARTDLTDEEKGAAKKDAQDKAKEATDAINAQPDNAATPEEAATAQTAVNNAKDKGVADVKAVNPVAKEAAKKAVADELAEKEKAIDARTDLTDEEKGAAKKDAQDKAKEATDAINAQPDNAATPEEAATAQTAVNNAKDKGVADVKAVNPVAKEAAKKAVADELAEKEKAIDKRTDLTDEEKAAAKDDAKAKAKAATDAIDAQPSNATTPEEAEKAQTAVNGAKDKGVADVTAVNPVAAKKSAAKADVETARKAKEDAIKANPNLTQAEKDAAIAKNNTAAEEATKAIDSATTNDGVDKAKEAGTGEIAKVNPVAKEAAKKAVADELAEKEKAIDARTDLTDEEKGAAKKDAQDKAKEATDAINAQPDNAATPEEAATAQTAVNNAKDKGVADVKAVNPVAKEAAKKAVADELAEKEKAIDARTDLTDEEKGAAKKDAQDKAKEATDAINAQPDNAATPEEAATAQTAVNNAKDKGVADVKAVNPVAKEAAKKAVADELAEKEKAIDKRTDLTDEEKAAAKDDAKAKAKAATDAIDAQPSNATTPEEAEKAQTAVNGAKDKGVADVTAVNPVAAKKSAAKADVETARKAKEDAIKANPNLTQAEKDAAIAKNNTAAEEATKAIDSATTNDGVDKAKEAGTGEIAKVNPVAKEAAKKAVADELAEKEKAIDARTDLTDAEKAAAKEDAKAKAKAATDAINAQPDNAATPEAAAEAQTAVNDAKDKGVADVKAVNPVAKEAAKKAIADELAEKEKAIDGRTDLTDEEKAAAKKDAQDKAKEATDAIDAQPSNAATPEAAEKAQTAVNGAKDKGVADVKAVDPAAAKKPAAKKAIDDALKAKEDAIDARTDLTDDEKKAAKDLAKDAADKAKAAIDAATTDAAVDTAKDAGTGAVEAINPEAKAKPEAKKAIDDALKAKEDAIDARTDLTDDEKKAAKEAAKEAADKAKAAIDAAPSNAEVDKAKEAGTGEIAKVNPVAKEAAKKAVADELAKKEAEIAGRNDLTDEEKAKAKEEAQAKAKEATDAIDAQPSNAETPEKAAEAQTAVDGAKDKGVADVTAVNPAATKKPEAKKAIDDALKAKEAAIDARTDLTDDEKKAAKDAAKDAADKAKEAIDAAPSNAEVDKAKEAGTGAVEAINPEAKAKPEAKQAIDDALKAKEAAIDARTDLTDDEKKAAKDAAKDAADKAKEAIDAATDDAALNKAKEAGTGEIAKVNPVAKEAAKKAVADELAKKEAEIAGRNDLTDEEKAKAKEEAQAKAKEATDAIDAQPSNAETPEKAAEAQTAVDGAKDKGVADVTAVNPAATKKPEAKQAIDDALKAKEAAIDARTDLTDDEKKAAKEAAKEAADKAKEAIDAAPSNAEVDKAKEAGTGEIAKVNPVAKEAAKKAVADELKAKEAEIAGRNDLTDEEKAKAKEEAQAKAKEATDAIDAQPSNAETPEKAAEAQTAVDGAKDKGVADVKAVDPEAKAKPVAKKAIEDKLAKQLEDIANTPDATDDEKKVAADAAKALAEGAKKEIDKAGTDAEVKQLQEEAEGEIEKSVPVVEDKPNARKAIEDEAKAKKEAIDARTDLTPKAKEDLKAQVDAIADQAKKSVDAAKTSEAVDGIEESDKAAIKAVGEVNIPADKVLVNNPSALTDDEKAKVLEAVKKVNPDAKEITQDADGNVTVTTPDGHKEIITPEQVVKTAATANDPKAGNDIVKPADKVVVNDPAKLTDAEKEKIKAAVEAVNPNSIVVVDDKGNAKVSTPDGQTQVIPVEELVRTVEDTKKPNAGNDIVKPADKTVVANPEKLTDTEKKAIEDKVKAVNPDATVVVDDKGNTTVTTPEGKTAVIPAADLTKDPETATKPNAGNDIVKPADKTAVKDPANLTPEEKKAIEDKVKAVNPGATVVVDDKGNATVTTPEGKTAVIPATDLTKDPEAATKPNAGNDIVKPADKTAVKDPANLTPEEKKAIEDKVKAVNPGATVVVDDKGNTTVTTPEGKTAVIPAADLTKDPETATKPNAGNDIVKPADKTAVKDPANLTPEEKKAIEDKVKAVNPGATVVVDDKGNATVTTPEGKTAVIPAADLTKDPETATKPNAGNDIVKPADKTAVKDPANLTPEEKKAIEDKVKAVNPGATVVVDDKGNATVTTPEGKTAVIPATDLTKSPADAAKANAGNTVNTPAAKVEVKDPAKLTDEEKAKVKEAIEAVNPGSKVVVDDKGNATVTTPEGDVVVIPTTDLTKSPADAGKANAGNAVNTPAAKVEVKDPAKLTDEEKAKVKKAVEDVNPGSKVVVDDKGNTTVTTSEGKTATIPAADVTKSAADAGKANAGNAVNTPAAKVEVKDPANLTDAEKKAIEDKVKAVNPGSKVVVDDKGNVTVTTPEGKTATIPAADVTKSAADAGKANAGNGANTPATKTVVKDPAKLTDEEKAKVKKAVEDVNPGSTVVVNDKGDVIVTKGDGTVLVIPELDLVIPEDKLTDPTQQNGVNTPATRVLVGDKAKLTADEIEKVKESIKAVNPGSTVVVDENGNATVTTPEGKTATIPAAQLVKDAKDVAAKNNGENINVDFEKETVADLNNLTDAEKEAAKAKIKGANADVVEVIFDKAGNATVITKDGKVYTIVAKDIFKQRPYVPSNGGGNNGATNTDAKVDKAKLEGAIRQLDELIIKESTKFDAETAKEANALSADAKKVFANADASQAEVDAMVKRIEDFMAKVASSTDHATPANDQAAQTPAVDTATTQAASAQANARKAAKELPNTGTADSTVAMVAAAASALLGLGLAGRRRKDDEEA